MLAYFHLTMEMVSNFKQRRASTESPRDKYSVGEMFAKHIHNAVLKLTTFKKFNREARKGVTQLKWQKSVPINGFMDE